jgi:hypothetical protein
VAELSQSAQAIWDAWNDAYEAQGPLEGMDQPLAAALQAAADQVCPSDAMEPRNYLPMAIECHRIRAELLAIAAELEAQQ